MAIIKPPTIEQEDPARRGVECPDCGCSHCPVYRTTKLLRRLRRERHCRHCGRKFFTTEEAPK